MNAGTRVLLQTYYHFTESNMGSSCMRISLNIDHFEMFEIKVVVFNVICFLSHLI
jgi:hypothetical protein